jgi:hypothetical protein
MEDVKKPKIGKPMSNRQAFILVCRYTQKELAPKHLFDRLVEAVEMADDEDPIFADFVDYVTSVTNFAAIMTEERYKHFRQIARAPGDTAAEVAKNAKPLLGMLKKSARLSALHASLGHYEDFLTEVWDREDELM